MGRRESINKYSSVQVLGCGDGDEEGC
jgi:hypothetical protein